MKVFPKWPLAMKYIEETTYKNFLDIKRIFSFNVSYTTLSGLLDEWYFIVENCSLQCRLNTEFEVSTTHTTEKLSCSR
jgi:hypothetical protein